MNLGPRSVVFHPCSFELSCRDAKPVQHTHSRCGSIEPILRVSAFCSRVYDGSQKNADNDARPVKKGKDTRVRMCAGLGYTAIVVQECPDQRLGYEEISVSSKEGTGSNP